MPTTSTESRRQMLLCGVALAMLPRFAWAQAASQSPMVTVWKDPNCGCCKLWVEHLRANGLSVQVRDTGNIGARRRLGVPSGLASCHTAEVAGYVVEGHVPASDIRRLLRERPAIRGLVLPGMPLGSPGMEVDGVDAPPYTVLALGKDGSTKPYAEHRP